MTIREAYSMTVKRLSAKDGDHAARSEARCLFEELFGLTRLKMYEQASRELSEEDEKKLLDAVEKRIQGVPLQYITGSWSFMGRNYLVDEGVLIPRDDTETAVVTFLERIKGRNVSRIADLCSGSGIIAITLAARLPSCSVTAIEKEEAAFAYLEKNISLNGAENVVPVRGDIFVCHKDIEDGSLDAIVSNPPYISTAELAELQTEVRFEPETALDGGEDGLDFYRCIAGKWLAKLKNGGIIVLEAGESQAEAVSSLLKSNGVDDIRVTKDIQGLDRVISGTKK